MTTTTEPTTQSIMAGVLAKLGESQPATADDAARASLAAMAWAGLEVIGPEYDHVEGCTGTEDGFHVLSTALCATCLEYPF